MTRPNASAHAHQDKLLDFAYGELPAEEARRVEQHVQSCAKCNDELGSIRGVRLAFSRLPDEPAPDAGLESLLAYANQKARQNAAGPEPAHAKLRVWLFGLAGVSALGLIGIVGVNMTVQSRAREVAAAEFAATKNRDLQPPVAAPAPAPNANAAPVAQGIGGLEEKQDKEQAPSGQLQALGTGRMAAETQLDSAQRLGTQDLVGKAARSKMKGGKVGVTRVDVDPGYRPRRDDGGGAGALSMRGGSVGSSYGVSSGAPPSEGGLGSTLSEEAAAEPVAQEEAADDEAAKQVAQAPASDDEATNQEARQSDNEPIDPFAQAQAAPSEREAAGAREQASKSGLFDRRTEGPEGSFAESDSAFAGRTAAPKPASSAPSASREPSRIMAKKSSPPPPPQVSSAAPSEPKSERSTYDRVRNRAVVADTAPSAPPAKQPLTREQEIAQLRGYVAKATGVRLAEFLTRLCELEREEGDKRATATCGQVMKQFAGTEYARRAARQVQSVSDTDVQDAKK